MIPERFQEEEGEPVEDYGIPAPATQSSNLPSPEDVFGTPAEWARTDLVAETAALSKANHDFIQDAITEHRDTKLPRVFVPGPAQINGNYHRVAIGDFTGKILHNLPDGILYRRGDLVGTIEGEPGSKRWVQLTNERVRHLVDDNARLQKSVVRNGNSIEIDCPCTDDYARLVMDAAVTFQGVRVLSILTHVPLVRRDRTLTPPGFEHGIFYDEPPELKGLSPTEDEDALTDLVIDFPFLDDASRANFFGLLITCLMRPAIDGNVPLHLVMSSKERTGKTKLIELVLGGLIFGSPIPAVQMQGTDEERDKRITALLLAGLSIVHMDNLREFLDSAALASLITSRIYMGRLLGVSRMLPLENNMVLVASGNNVRATGEIVKRIVPIVLQPRTDAPELRTDIVHRNLPAYVKSVRKRVLGALLFRALVGGSTAVRMGGFEEWVQCVGPAVGEPWMDNAKEWREESDPEGEDLKRFADEWWKRHRSEYVSAKDLLIIADEIEAFGSILARVTNDRARLIAFSMRVLKKNIRTPVGTFQIGSLKSGNQQFWRLESSEQ